MQQKLPKILKAKIHPYMFAIGILFIITLVSAIGGILHYGSELNSNYEVTAAENLKKQAKGSVSSAKNPEKKTANGQNSSDGNSSLTYGGGANAVSANTPGTSFNNLGTSSSSKHVSYVKVYLSVNGNPKGVVTLKSTDNQCEVLAQAKAQGVIGSLVMKYNDALNSYGVYVIDGIGRTDQVYWTYKVNGKPPPLGCSYVTVHGGDSINWQYLN